MEHEVMGKGILTALSRLKIARYVPKEEIPEIEGYRPDVFAVRKLAARRVMKAVVQVEAPDTILEEKAKKKMKAFAEWSSKYGSRTTMLFVPAGYGPKAKADLPQYDEYYEF